MSKLDFTEEPLEEKVADKLEETQLKAVDAIDNTVAGAVAEVVDTGAVAAEVVDTGAVAEVVDTGAVAEVVDTGAVADLVDNVAVAEVVDDGAVAEVLPADGIAGEAVATGEDALSATDEHKETQWIAPPDPFEIKKKRTRKIITVAILSICIFAIGLLVFILFTSRKDEVKEIVFEQPMIYEDGNGVLKIYMQNMEAPVALGNQGHATDTNLEMFKASVNNKNLAYITAGKSLFMLPAAEATTGTIDAKYHVEDDVEEILAFAPDNDNLIYFIGKNKVLKMYDGKKVTIIAEDIYIPLAYASSEEGLPQANFFPLNNGRIIYYTGLEGNATLTTQTAGQSNKVELGKVDVSNILPLKVDDEGIAYNAVANEASESGRTQIFYYNFKKTDDPFILADIEGFLQVIINDGKGNITVVEKQSGVTDEAGVTLIQPDSQGVRLYLYTKTGERKLISDNLADLHYVSNDSKALIYSVLGGEVGSETNSYWYALVDNKQNVLPPQLITTISADSQSLFLEMDNGKDFLCSVPNAGGDTITTKLYTIEKNKLVEKKTLDELGAGMPYQTLNGQIFSLRDPLLVENMFYTVSAYFMKDGEPTHIADGVDVQSFGNFTSGLDKHGDRVLFIKDGFVEDGAPYGTLALYDGVKVVDITERFILPRNVRTVYVYDNLIYYFDIDMVEQKINIMKYTGDAENVLLDSGIQRIYSGH